MLKMKEVPLGVDFGERVDVPPGNGKEEGIVDPGDENSSNPRIKFLQEHNDPKKYAFFTDKEGLAKFNFKPGYEAEKRLNDYSGIQNGQYIFGDTMLSETDNIYCKEIKVLPMNERYQFFSTPDNKFRQFSYFDSYNRPMGKYVDHAMDAYVFEDGKSDDERKLFYTDDSVAGGRRKRKTKAKKSKKRRTNKKTKSRS
jgi:hypothetical protein